MTLKPIEASEIIKEIPQGCEESEMPAAANTEIFETKAEEKLLTKEIKDIRDKKQIKSKINEVTKPKKNEPQITKALVKKIYNQLKLVPPENGKYVSNEESILDRMNDLRETILASLIKFSKVEQDEGLKKVFEESSKVIEDKISQIEINQVKLLINKLNQNQNISKGDPFSFALQQEDLEKKEENNEVKSQDKKDYKKHEKKDHKKEEKKPKASTVHSKEETKDNNSNENKSKEVKANIDEEFARRLTVRKVSTGFSEEKKETKDEKKLWLPPRKRITTYITEEQKKEKLEDKKSEINDNKTPKEDIGVSLISNPKDKNEHEVFTSRLGLRKVADNITEGKKEEATKDIDPKEKKSKEIDGTTLDEFARRLTVRKVGNDVSEEKKPKPPTNEETKAAEKVKEGKKIKEEKKEEVKEEKKEEVKEEKKEAKKDKKEKKSKSTPTEESKTDPVKEKKEAKKEKKEKKPKSIKTDEEVKADIVEEKKEEKEKKPKSVISKEENVEVVKEKKEKKKHGKEHKKHDKGLKKEHIKKHKKHEKKVNEKPEHKEVK
ncbi:hypothetical protein ENU1_171020 [Entamoeba nuttalli P19]|uniref:Uncharacterized protein n=1 Tax=Entamoeba nuttalli (strain P19) TaxID=1076696 RepID=K2GWX6_ENTNP|nr:hypothetical protein ENU1_171020 [Entamoeba nuttalli P19]EKE38292.1 hypothetical protein ENU1_171020 [Entamoeba nuttalli P19]|eukprot:XP_008859373.1 hypothetical protein ENU1_171020 [Entamoeba nuttalli P19]